MYTYIHTHGVRIYVWYIYVSEHMYDVSEHIYDIRTYVCCQNTCMYTHAFMYIHHHTHLLTCTCTIHVF